MIKSILAAAFLTLVAGPAAHAQYSDLAVDPLPIPAAGVEPASVDIDLTGGVKLSDEELLDLYAASHKQSLRAQLIDASSLVMKGDLLVRMGYTYSLDENDLEFRTTEHTIPELLVRYRIARRLELRAGWSGATRSTLTDELSDVSDTDYRFANPSFGVRLGLWTQNGLLPRTSVTVSSPYDSEVTGGFTDRLTPGVTVGYGWRLGQNQLLSAGAGAIWDTEGDVTYTDFKQSLSYAIFLADKLDVHLTYSALMRDGADEPNHSIGPGFSHRLHSRFQWDVITAFGLDEVSPDTLIQVFATWRL